MSGQADAFHMMEIFKTAAEAAGQAILHIRAAGCIAETKPDASPVTAADREAERIIVESLAAAFPAIPYIAEEACSEGLSGCATHDGFFLIDPLDGTREFVAGRDEFTVNIAYVVDGRPVVGMVHVPATGESFGGLPGTALKWRAGAPSPEAIAARHPPEGGMTALVSRSHRTPQTDAYLEGRKPAEIVPMGSSLKFCRIAEGAADLYPCLGTTMEWDTAAAEAVLVGAGGRVETLEGRPLRYGKHADIGRRGFANPPFVAYGASPSA
ncbi:3'(2'),5'-bisphosphate nucleotidase CysQ [Aureimonas altamirensis]|uniref:3'(2'),5'-bisphosphate nucleotidase CysQ n=1 Tax=Aureimonas altamirensis TaxID=370622 RepID=UPI002556EEB2|nr:3'(2'),5'-bisphosphate nucleotidase CysQ [Aureimonas altamirensis]